MKTLIIAEKPSVALDITRALGRFQKVDDHYENDEFIVSAASGHLVELFMPEDIDKKRYGFWRLGELPIIPDEFKLKPIDEKRSKDRLNSLKKLMKRKDVDRILNACDAGREGELIFTYIYQVSECKKPFQRVWMQSMTRDAIRDAFGDLRSPEQMRGLQDAARSRSEADWLIGINGTRAITKRMFGRGRGVATVGRVQTPTLSIVWRREQEIRNFEPRAYWEIHAEFGVTAGTYPGLYQRPEFKEKQHEHDRADRVWDLETAQRVLAEAEAAPYAVVSESSKKTRQSSGRLYDLTSLQREANGRYGFSAARTLRAAQSLYEKHKLITYPRTDSRALPEDYLGVVKSTLGKLTGELGDKAKKALDKDWVKPNKRIFNNAQVSDHFAIIPTGESVKKLTEEEARIYDMIARRFVAIFYPPAEFNVTTRISALGSHEFKTEGKVLTFPGYLEVYGKAELDQQLPALGQDDIKPDWARGLSPQPPADQAVASRESIDLMAEETKPPSRYTEATLLSAMEGAGKLVEDEELAEAMKEKGLGTPATRAATIDHLLREKYMERDGRYLVPTAKAEDLFEFLGAVNVEVLTQPDLTGEWEHKLLMMEHNQLSREEFMEGIRDLTKKIVDRTRSFDEDDESVEESSVISPTDNLPMLSYLRSYRSQDGALNIYKTIGNRRMAEQEVQELVSNRQVGPFDDFRSKAGKPYSAILRLDPNNKVVFDFGNGGGDDSGDGSNGKPDLSTLNVIGVFKETGAKVYEAPNAYLCENAAEGDSKNAFRISRTLLGKSLEPAQVKKLLEEGKTDLIKGFRSKKTGRLFDAFIVLKPGGGIGFDFPPRAAKKGATKKSARKAAKKAARKQTE